MLADKLSYVTLTLKQKGEIRLQLIQSVSSG